jgi:hypothetical protein
VFGCFIFILNSTRLCRKEEKYVQGFWARRRRERAKKEVRKKEREREVGAENEKGKEREGESEGGESRREDDEKTCEGDQVEHQAERLRSMRR